MDTVSSEGDADLHSGPVLSGRGVCECVGSDGDSINNLVGKVKESRLDAASHGRVSVGGGKGNGDGGVLLSELTGESQGKGLVNKVSLAGLTGGVDGVDVRSSTEKGDGLDLLHSRNTSVGAGVKAVVTVGALTGGTVDSSPSTVADAGTAAIGLPVVVGDGADGTNPDSVPSSHAGDVIVRMPGIVSIIVLVEDTSEGQLVHLGAGSMSAAVIGAGLATASLALVSAEALALSKLTVADSLSGTLSILVGASLLVGGINPGKLKRAETCCEWRWG